MGIWIDERGRIVRPAEPAWTYSRTDLFGGKPIATEGERYVAALGDWVTNGERSAFVLTDGEFAARMRPRSRAELEADATFKLAVWMQRSGRADRAAHYFQRAQQLNPDDWNYHRQEWSFETPADARAKWLAKFQQLETPYYAPLAMDAPPRSGVPE
jgi:hypothetical protein